MARMEHPELNELFNSNNSFNSKILQSTDISK